MNDNGRESFPNQSDIKDLRSEKQLLDERVIEDVDNKPFSDAMAQPLLFEDAGRPFSGDGIEAATHADQEMILQKTPRVPGPLEAGLLFSLMAVIQLYGGQLLSLLNLTGVPLIALSEVILIALPPTVFALLFRHSLTATFRIRRPRLRDVGVVLMISPVATIAAYCAGLLAIVLVKMTFGTMQMNGDLGDVFSQGVPWAVVAIGLFPAVCEEWMFRGFFQRGMEGFGGKKAVILSGVLFGLFHFDFQRFAAQALLGCIIAYVVYRTGSIFNGMIIHFLHNAGSVVLSSLTGGLGFVGQKTGAFSWFAATASGDVFSSEAFNSYVKQSGMSLDELIQAMAVGSSVALILSLFVLFGLLLLLRYITRDVSHPSAKAVYPKKAFLPAVPGLLLILLVYSAIGLSLLNLPAGEWIMNLLRL